MPQAVMLCVDCSEYMRNGDYKPTRFRALKDLVRGCINQILQEHMENVIGVIAMGGNRKADILCNLLSDQARALLVFDKMEIGGETSFLAAIQTAQLALKHRANKVARQRIVMFVGSPARVDKKALVKAGKQMKKNKVVVDVLSFGETEENQGILQAFRDAASPKNDAENQSKFLQIPPGGDLQSAAYELSGREQQQASSAPAASTGAASGAAAGGDDFGGLGFDPNLDPELAMALRMSMQEHMAGPAANTDASAPEVPATVPEATGASAADTNPDEDDDDDMDEEMDEELQRAIAMSMAADKNADDGDAAPGDSAAPNVDAQLQNADFINELLHELPGVAADDIDVDALLEDVPDNDGGDKSAKKDDNAS